MKVIKRMTLLIMTFTLMFCISAFVMSAEKKDDKGTIKRGVRINGENVSGMKKKEATRKVRDAVNKKTNIKVKIKVGDYTCETRLVDLGYEWSNVDIVDDAIEYGKVGSPITRYYPHSCTIVTLQRKNRLTFGQLAFY